MNDDLLPNKGAAPDTTAADEEEVRTDQVFDISDDGISPVRDEPVTPALKKQIYDALKDPLGYTRAAAVQPVIAPITPPKPQLPKLDPNVDLLDKKIGTFDTTPFATPIQAAPIQTAPTVIQTPVAQPEAIPDFEKIRPESSIPLVDISIPPEKSRTGPANPPTKNIGSRLSDYTATDQTLPSSKPQNLQDAVASVLPKEFQPDNSAQNSIKNTPPPAPIGSTTASPGTPSSDNIVKPIRTYESDVADAMSHKRSSRASIAIAESRRAEGEEKLSSGQTGESRHVGKKLVMMLASLILLGGGVIGAYYLYSLSPLAPVTPIAPTQNTDPSLVPSDFQTVVTINTQNPHITLTRIQSEYGKTQAPGTIKEIIVATSDQQGLLRRISARDMISALDIDTPDILSRSLTPDWMLGIYADPAGDKSAFVVATTDFFQNTFAGMLQWERVMADDLKQYLFPIAPAGVSNTTPQTDSSTTTRIDPLSNINSILPSTTGSTTGSQASSTTSVSTTTEPGPTDLTSILQPYFTIQGTFHDRIVKNRDVREFITDTGQTLFLYSFIDNTHMVIAANENTLIEILTRLEKQSFIR